jgi:hypothetical protein
MCLINARETLVDVPGRAREIEWNRYRRCCGKLMGQGSLAFAKKLEEDISS